MVTLSIGQDFRLPTNGQRNNITKNLTAITRDLRKDAVERKLKAQDSEEKVL